MGKITKCLYVESEHWDQLQKNGVNVSEAVREFMEQLVNIKNGSISGIDIQLTKHRLERNQEKLAKLQAEIKADQDLLTKAEELRHKRELEKLEKERQLLENSKSCINCGAVLDDKEKRAFNAGVVCKACYMCATAKDIKRWSRTPDPELEEAI